MKSTKHKFLLLAAMLAVAFSISGCGPEEQEPSTNGIRDAELLNFNLPVGMKDCKVFRLHGERGMVIIATRCPHSVTTTHAGKVQVVVGEEEDEQ